MRRLKSAVTANLALQVVAVGGNLAFVPVYIHAFGPELYGLWLILLGVLSMLPLFDLGVGAAVANRAIHEFGANRSSIALTWCKRGWAWTSVICLASMTFIGMIGALLLGGVMGQCLLFRELKVLIFAAALYMPASIVFSYATSVLKAVGRNDEASWISFSAIACEVVLPGFSVLAGAEFLVAICTVVGSRVCWALISFFYQAQVLDDVAPAASSEVSWRSVVRPSLGNLLYPISNAIYLQCSVVLLGGQVGLESAAIFSLSRTISRIPFQANYAVLRAHVPSLARAYGQGGGVSVGSAARPVWKWYCRLTLPALMLCGLLSSWFIVYWTSGKLHLTVELALIMAASTALHSYANLSYGVLATTNRHLVRAASFAVAVCIFFLFLRQLRSLEGVALAVLLFEAVSVGLTLFITPVRKT